MRKKIKQTSKMADEDEIDILGDFSFNSCFAQNNQGIPSCSDREDTVHPQWLQDSVSTNWYDIQSNNRSDGPSRKLSGNSARQKFNRITHTSWNEAEKEILIKEMAKYGRNVRKISQTLKTKTEAEIQALIEAEYGVHLDTPSFGVDRHDDFGDVPTVAHEEIVPNELPNVLNMVTTGSPTIVVPKKPFAKKNVAKNSLLKTNCLLDSNQSGLSVNPSEIFYEDDLIIGSTESIGSDMDSVDVMCQKMAKQNKEKVKIMKKMGNHRRKVSRNFDRGRPRNRNNDLLKSPPGRQRKNSSTSDDSTKSPKMQIVLGSGVALPVSEGEQVIKIEKKKNSDSESDIDIDVDSDDYEKPKAKEIRLGEPIAVPVRKFEPMPKRQKKINLDGGGGYTIMHTDSGDLYEIAAEPRKERAPKKQPVPLLHCRVYNAEKPAPFEVRLNVSALISMDVHAHTSRGEVMGLAGGGLRQGDGEGPVLTVRAYRPANAAAGGTHCDMDPVSQAEAADYLTSLGHSVCAWHHSHPSFPAAPSAADLRSQRMLQQLKGTAPLVGLITSQHWPTGRTATQFRCIRVEDDTEDSDIPTGYQFSVKLVPDLTADNLQTLLDELRAICNAERTEYSVDMARDVCPQAAITYLEKLSFGCIRLEDVDIPTGYQFSVKLVPDLTADNLQTLLDELRLIRNAERTEYSVDMARDVCPQAAITYLDKCISSVSHHMRSAGYEDGDSVVADLIKGIRDVFR